MDGLTADLFTTDMTRKPKQQASFASGICLAALLLVNAGCNQSATEPQAESAAPKHNSSESGDHPLNIAPEDSIASSPNSQPVIQIQPASQSRVLHDPMQTAALDPQQQAEQIRLESEPTAFNMADAATASSGTPEWDIQQIASVLSQAKKRQIAQRGQDTETILTDEENRRIVALATHAISQTHQRPEKSPIFTAAIHSLMDARLKLALAGDQKSLDAIYEDAATLAADQSDAPAAAIASGTVVRLTKAMAARDNRDSPWISEYVRQAKLFAANFPQEEARAIVQLTEAAEFCEKHQLILPAIECYSFIQQKFPESPFNRRSDAALQRLNLIGKPLPLAGPTLSGSNISLSDMQGKPALIVFWSSHSQAFLEDLPVIEQLCEQSGCHLVGINLDTNEQQVRQFVEQHSVPGEHIFYPDAALQGASQPMAQQFGIHTVPSYWLVDQQGRVLSTYVTRPQLKALVQKAR